MAQFNEEMQYLNSLHTLLVIRLHVLGFPGGSAVESACQCKGQEFWSLVWDSPRCHGAAGPIHPGHGAWAVEPGAAATEPVHHKHQRPSLCSSTREATAMRSLCTASREQPLLAATRKKPGQQQRSSTAKNLNK